MATNTGPTHWLLQTPQQLLSEYNDSSVSRRQCTRISVRTFIFAQNSLLLIKWFGKWKVPIFDLTGEVRFDPTKSEPTTRLPGSNERSIRDEVLLRLTRKTTLDEGVPENVLREIQFMDFSQPQPLKVIIPIDPAKLGHSLSDESDEMIISVILTTKPTLLSQALPGPPTPPTHWANMDEMLDLGIPLVQSSPTKDFNLGDVSRAHQRHQECSTWKSSPTTDPFRTVKTCNWMLKSILHANFLTVNDPNLTFGFGWIALGQQSPDVRFLLLFPADSRQEAARSGSITYDKQNYRIVAYWADETVMWLEITDFWEAFIDDAGRLRALFAPQERTSWGVTFDDDSSQSSDAETNGDDVEMED